MFCSQANGGLAVGLSLMNSAWAHRSGQKELCRWYHNCSRIQASISLVSHIILASCHDHNLSLSYPAPCTQDKKQKHSLIPHFLPRVRVGRSLVSPAVILLGKSSRRSYHDPRSPLTNAVRKPKTKRSKNVTLPAVNTCVCVLCVCRLFMSRCEKKKTRCSALFVVEIDCAGEIHHRAATPEPPKTRPSMPLILLTRLPPSCRSLSSSALIS